MHKSSGYTLTEMLHEGSHTSLHRGRRDVDGAPVLLKLLRGEYPSPREIARLRHEYLIGRDLAASGVVEVHALEKVGHGLALVLGDVGGRTLAQILQSERLPLATALQIASRLAKAVGAIHDRHVIHKDIKPESVLVNLEAGIVQLTSFGIATRLSQEIYKETAPAALEGSLPYISPEQTGRMNRALDYRTDLYSLGVTLYEMLTGALPFAATEPMELVHSHIARMPLSPRERSPNVPEVVSAIVMKLLAKAAEDRYQSADGLAADLDACIERLHAGASIAPFPLGQKDSSGELRIAQKLYGREVETAALLAAFERASRGGAELFLVAGYAGVGKSTLVNEVHQAIARRGGRFCAGKFDQLGRNVPYSAVAAALRQLIRHLLTEPEESLAHLRLELLTAVESNGQILVDLIPELERVIGRQPAVPQLGPSESQNRFNLVFQRFLRVFSTAKHPLVLFLDDLQWADPASLKLLSILLTDPERGHLLIIGAYRDHEVTPGHLLSLSLEELRAGGAVVNEIALEPLGLADVGRLLADTLGHEGAKVAPLSRVVFDKTHGNPFFLCQLLQSLHEGGLITFSRGAGAWTWDLERMRAAEVTDNVVELMAAKIARLPAETRRVVSLAACIGHQFDLKTLAVISETQPRATSAALWVALLEGLLLPLDDAYRFLAEADADTEGDAVLPQMFDAVAYRFLHDRVQQAAYSFIEERQKQRVHLQVGRLLRDQSDAAERDERLFTIVDHMNLGGKLIEDRGERIELAKDNVTAAKRAKAAAAYQAALGYVEAAAALIDEACWEEAYPLAFTLHLERAELSFLNGHFEAAESLFDGLLAHTKSRQDRAQVYKLCILLATARGDFAGAIRCGRAALAMFGIDIPETREQQQAALAPGFAALDATLARRSLEQLREAPLLVDPDHRTPLEILVQLSPSAFFSGPPIDALVAILLADICLSHGRSELAAFAYAYVAEFQILVLRNYKKAADFFWLGCALDEQFDAPALRGRTNVVFASQAHHYVSFRDVLPYVERAQRATLSAGDYLFLAFTCYHDVMPRLCAGEELSSVRDAVHRNLALARQTKSDLVIATLIIARQLIAALEGRTRGRTSLDDDAYDEAAHRAQLAGNPSFGFAWSWLHAVEMQLAYLHGDYAAALAAATEAAASGRASGVSVFHYWTDIPFYAGLALAALIPSASDEDKARHAAQLAEEQAQIAVWAESCPANYRYKQLLLAAEAARIAGKHDEADGLYDEAIDAARENEVTHHEALANELAGRHYLARGRKKIAQLYMNAARHGYLRWGATAKASDLAEKYPDLLDATVNATQLRAARDVDTNPGDGISGLDVATLVRASQAIASEIVLENLLERLMRTVVENAGADRGVLLLTREGRLIIEATMTVEPDVVRVGLGAPLEAGADLAMSVVHFVQRSLEPVVLGDAAHAGAFADDPYLLARPPKSLLCLAMVQKGMVIGILYLENHAARDAFTPAGVEMSRLLSSQAAIAVENALLVAELRRRTADVSAANEALRAANERLERDILALEQAERSREALKGELLRVQTPFIPITDQIVVMPLIGMIDAARAEQVLETALRGVQASRARVVILDVTGVEQIDAEVTGMLLGTARALRLLGAQVVITGIRADMARILVELQVDLSAVVIKGTLQHGIVYAMDRLKRGAGR
ncbi:AAA family ATPase [Polyangium aurulentum]|uniref:AAA family ATPase n=1 Tax=Polyangium aurulentum TaxID=2567896 RepID=UPI0010ADF474|nr:AAA family ATPase [Polyangium aurulentum]UQA56910.1 AAA family ATPase [Polyangium aurulentum]